MPLKQITSNELTWALKVAPPLASCGVRLWNETYTKGVLGHPLTWDKSWDVIFQARVELLEVTVNVYMLGRLFRLLGAEVRTVVLVPGVRDMVLKAPIAYVPFGYEPG